MCLASPGLYTLACRLGLWLSGGTAPIPPVLGMNTGSLQMRKLRISCKATGFAVQV